MTKKSATIVFFGSGPVAAGSLEYLARHFTIEAVVTKPRPSHHKGDFPVLNVADTLKLTIYTATNRQELNRLFDGRPFQSQLGVLVDFGIIVSKRVIDYFPRGIINSHFSLLPEWRGADPITFSILSGQEKTGVSLMLLSPALDEGLLLAQTPYELPEDITTPALTDTLVDISNECLRTTIPLWLEDKAQAMPQEAVTMADSAKPSYSRKLTKEDGILDWRKPAVTLEREIRAFAEWPKSHSTIAGKEVIVTAAHVAKEDGPSNAIGLVHKTPEGLLGVTTSDGLLIIDKLKPAGKPEMTGQAFLAGYGRLLN